MTLKHVTVITRRGRDYRYLRVPGKPMIRLPDDPMESPAFLLAYAEALETVGKRLRAKLGTIAAGVEAAMKTTAWASYSDSYRMHMRPHLDAIRDKGKEASLTDLRARHVKADVAAIKGHPARQRLKAWRFLGKVWVDAGLLRDDPTEGVSRPVVPATKGFPVWTQTEIADFRARWPVGTVQRRAFEVLFWTGARVSDGVRVGPAMVGKDGILAFRQQKTGDMAYVPITCTLPPFADRDDHAHFLAAIAGPMTMTWLETAHGKARSVPALGHLVSQAAANGKSAHGLRKARAVSLADMGATTHQIAAWTGHHSLEEVQHYTADSDRRRAVRGTDPDQETAKQSGQTAKHVDK